MQSIAGSRRNSLGVDIAGGLVELADTLVLGTSASCIRVQVSYPPPYFNMKGCVKMKRLWKKTLGLFEWIVSVVAALILVILSIPLIVLVIALIPVWIVFFIIVLVYAAFKS